MTVKQLKEKLTEFPDQLDVMIAPRVTDFAYGGLESVYSKEIGFQEAPGGKILAMARVVIIDEEI